MGLRLVEGLRAIGSPLISEIRAVGLMVGVQLSRNFPKTEKTPAIETVVRCMAGGLLVIPAGDAVVRFLPPLNAKPAEIDEAVEKFAAALRSFPTPA
jgi:acetylornithine/succinyldiaminopimelate/putrescine aminotransferase